MVSYPQDVLKRGSHTSIPQLRDAIPAYVDTHNEEANPFKWMKSTDKLFKKVCHFGFRTQQVYAE